MLIKTVFSAGISELPNLNLMGEQFWGFCLLLFSNSSPNPFPLESFSTWIFSLFMHPPSGLKNWQSDLGLLCGDEDALAKGYLLDSYNCSIDWLRSSCRVLTKYRHSETADYNPWVKRPELRQFLTSKASGSWQGGGEWATQEDEMEPMANLVSIVLIFSSYFERFQKSCHLSVICSVFSIVWICLYFACLQKSCHLSACKFTPFPTKDWGETNLLLEPPCPWPYCHITYNILTLHIEELLILSSAHWTFNILKETDTCPSFNNNHQVLS